MIKIKINTPQKKNKKTDFKEKAKELGISSKEYKKRFFKALHSQQKKDKQSSSPLNNTAQGKISHRKAVKLKKHQKKIQKAKAKEDKKREDYYNMLQQKF